MIPAGVGKQQFAEGVRATVGSRRRPAFLDYESTEFSTGTVITSARIARGLESDT